MDKNDKMINDFSNRLISILKENPRSWWKDQLDSSQSVIGAWIGGSNLPKGDNLLKILNVKGISANWLLFGVGNKYLQDYDDNKIEQSQEKNRSIQRYIFEKEQENTRLRNKIQSLERVGQTSKLFESLLSKKSINDENQERIDLFETVALPLMVMVKSAQDVIFKAFEMYVKKSATNAEVQDYMNKIDQNFEKNKFNVLATLRDHTIFDEKVSE